MNEEPRSKIQKLHDLWYTANLSVDVFHFYVIEQGQLS